MDRKIQNTGLALADDPIADGKHFFTFAEARRRLGCSPAAGSRVDAKRLAHYARRLGWAMALRRIGSIADVLEVTGLAGRLRPFRPIRSDLDLEPGAPAPHAWRDTRWHVRWPQPVDEIRAVARQ